MNADLYKKLQIHAQTNPHKPALIFQRGTKWETCTYQKIHELSEQLVQAHTAQGLRAGQCAVLLTPPSPEFFALTFALLKLNITLVLVDPAIGLRNNRICIKSAS